MAKKKIVENKQLRSLEASGFYSDFEKPDILYAKLIRSPTFTGIINSITVPDLPEGYTLFTADDIPGKKNIEINKTEVKIFGYGKILYNEEPLAILIGPNENKLNELAENASFSFDIESFESALKEAIKQRNKPVLDLDESDSKSLSPQLRPSDPILSDFLNQINEMPSLDKVLDTKHIEQNTSITVAEREIKYGLYEQLPVAEADAKLFEGKKYFSNETWCLNLVNPKWHETNGAFAYMEGNILHIYVPSKWSFIVQKTISEVLNIPKENVFVHKTKTTGVFSNGLWRTTIIAAQVALASYLSKKPVKLVYTQHEQKHFMAPGPDTRIFYNVAMLPDGTIDTMKISAKINVGCANPFAKELTDRIALASFSYYKPKNLYVNVETFTSKNPPTSIDLTKVESQAFFAIENQIQTISRITQIFPDEVRQLNANTKKNENFPFTIQLEKKEETIANTIRISDFNRKYASYRMDAITRIVSDSNPFFALPLRGVGLATAYNSANYLGAPGLTHDISMEVTLTSEDKVIIHAITPSDVIKSIWKSTASEIFQLPKENIEINSLYEIENIPPIPDDVFSTIGLMNELLKKCCNDIQKKRFHQPLPISSKKTVTSSMKKNWDKENFKGNPYSTTSFACTAVEVELDPYTYSEKIKGVYISISCGRVFDKNAALRNVRLEIQQELTMLVEGKTVACDNIMIDFIPSDTKAGQIRDLVHNTLPAAFAAALSLALATQLTKLPCTETQLFKLIKNRENRLNNTNKSELPIDSLTEGDL